MQDIFENLKKYPVLAKYAPIFGIISTLLVVYNLLPSKFKEEIEKKIYDHFFKWIGESWKYRTTRKKLRVHCRRIIERWENREEYKQELITLTLIPRRDEDTLTGERSPEEPVTIEQLLDRHYSSLLVTGYPGSGKTTLQKRFEYEYAKRYLEKSGQPLPVFLELKYYDKAKKPEEWVSLKLKDLGIATEEPKHRLVLLLDGFNEIEGSNDNDREVIRNWREYL